MSQLNLVISTFKSPITIGHLGQTQNKFLTIKPNAGKKESYAISSCVFDCFYDIINNPNKAEEFFRTGGDYDSSKNSFKTTVFSIK